MKLRINIIKISLNPCFLAIKCINSLLFACLMKLLKIEEFGPVLHIAAIEGLLKMTNLLLNNICPIEIGLRQINILIIILARGAASGRRSRPGDPEPLDIVSLRPQEQVLFNVLTVLLPLFLRLPSSARRPVTPTCLNLGPSQKELLTPLPNSLLSWRSVHHDISYFWDLFIDILIMFIKSSFHFVNHI